MKMSCCAAITAVRRRTPLLAGAVLGLALLVPAACAFAQDEGLALLGADSRVSYSPELAGADWSDASTWGDGSRLGITWRDDSGVTISGGYRAYPDTATQRGGCLSDLLDFNCSSPFSPLQSSSASAGGEFGLGASWEPLDGLSMGLGYRRGEASRGAAAEALLLPRVLDFLAPGWESSLDQANRNGDEVDLNLAYGFDAGLIGELEVKVQLSHVLDPTPLVDRPPRLNGGIGILQPSSTQATIGFNWSRGNFSGNLSSHYADGLLVDGQLQSSGWTTVDINFAWRTPWNASLSVGAQNLLGQDPGVDSITPPEIDDAFSRVPYVRYEQDL